MVTGIATETADVCEIPLRTTYLREFERFELTGWQAIFAGLTNESFTLRFQILGMRDECCPIRSIGLVQSSLPETVRFGREIVSFGHGFVRSNHGGMDIGKGDYSD